MHQSPGFISVGASREDGMVAPCVPLSVKQQENAHLCIRERSLSESQAHDVLVASGTTLATSKSLARNSPAVNAKVMATIGVSPQDEENGLCLNGHTQCFCKHAENGSLIEEPKTEMEGFIMREHDIDVIREPVTEVKSAVKEAPDDYRNLQPKLPSKQGDDGTANDNSAPHQKRRVQWIDNFGKELVQVLEYEASDTGESEEEDDDTDAHACTCTIQ
ncbi:hypothetical protein GOP47_0029280 [Adiantum capillus-veneris]|nr:hypothetical protein GOP47_0029280 [Adiantum capillus-veneris]